MENGIAGKIASGFLQSKLSILLMIAFLLLGAYSVYLIPREEEPQIQVPVADIFMSIPGATPKEVETKFLAPLERVLWNVPKIEHIFSSSMNGGAMLTVQFYVGEDLQKSLVNLYNEILKHMDQMPPGVSMPLIKTRSIDDVPVLALTLWSDKLSDYTLRKQAELLRSEIKKINYVTNINIIGGREKQLRIKLDRSKMAGANLDMLTMSHYLQSANMQVDAGNAYKSNKVYIVGTNNFLRTVDDVKNLIVGMKDGEPIYLSSVAEINEGPSTSKNYVSYEGNPAVTIAISKQNGKDAQKISNKILKKIDKLQKESISPDVNIEVTRNYGKSASDKVSELLVHLLGSIIAVTLFVMLAMGWRGGLVVFLSVPVTFALTLFAYYFMDYTLNRITLFALVFVTGIVVDDSIIVSENMHRHFKMKYPSMREAALYAINEVGNPTILATLTVIAAVLPMAFVSGLMGPYMSPMPIGATVAMSFSLIVALTLTPYLGYIFLKHKENCSPEDIKDNSNCESETNEISSSLEESLAFEKNVSVEDVLNKNSNKVENVSVNNNVNLNQIEKINLDNDINSSITNYLNNIDKGNTSQKEDDEDYDVTKTKLYSWYNWVMEPMLKSRLTRWVFMISTVILLLLSVSLFYFKLVPVKMLPFDNKNEFQIVIDMPEGTPLEQTNSVTQEIGLYLKTRPMVKNYQTYVGTASPISFNGLMRHYDLRKRDHVADIQVNLIDKENRSIQSHDIAKAIRPGVQKIAKKMNANVKVVEVPPGPPVLSTMVVEVYGPNYETQIDLAIQIKKEMEKVEGIVDVDIVYEEPQNKMLFTVDRDKALRNGVSPASITENLQIAVSGKAVGLLHQDNVLSPIPIVLELNEADKMTVSELENLPIKNNMNKVITLGSLTKLNMTYQPLSINRKDQKRVVMVTAELAGDLESPIYAMLKMESSIKNLKLPEAYKLDLLNNSQPEYEDDYSVKWDGEWQITYEVFRDLGIAFMVAILIIYLLIVGWFQNFTVPLVMLAAIPLSLIGIVVGHWIMGSYFSATSMIGFIALAGIMVRNSILLIDFINIRLDEGAPLYNAIIEAGAVRTLPIILTAGTVVLGAIVILFDPLFQGLAISLMGGTITSTILTLIVVPLLYFKMLKKRVK